MGIINHYLNLLGKSAEKEIEEKVVQFLPKGRNLIYLDLGCNDGQKTSRRAFQIGTTHVVGAEVNKDSTREAKKRGITVYNLDLNHSWPFKDNSFDCITATEVIEHLVDLDMFFSETKRILKPKGKIIISTENLAAYHNIIALILGNQPYTGPYLSKIYSIGHRPCGTYYKLAGEMRNPHLNVMTIKALRQLLQKYCFKNQKIEGVAFYPLPIPVSNLMTRIDLYHASYCVVVAEK